jgi:TolB protein
MKYIIALTLLLLTSVARAELIIEITQGRDNPTSIAVVPFGWSGWGSAPEDVASVVQGDLMRSGQFAPVAREDMLGLPTRESEVYYRDWRSTNVEYLLIGRVTGGTGIGVEYELYDVYRQERVLQGTVNGSLDDMRMLAHRVSDKVYEKLTGIRGAFATRILYVAATQRVNAPSTFTLVVADSDGGRPKTVFESNEPILSPAWAPDANRIAYVSFETTRPAIYLHNLATDEREQLTNFKGLNGAPAFSPDGNSMAMVLSKDGNPDIYIMDLGNRQLQRVTRHYAIDTEPAWMPDGRSLVFTSDRGGRPQIYRVDIPTGHTERVTYEGPWNARASIAADGRTMVMVQQETTNQFHIAVQDLLQDRVQILTSTNLDESPSVAPNGSMLLYATKYNGRGILAAVSVDGGVKFRLPSREGDVREPAWSPYLDAP